jgi:pSer/pThr/pTyr-binding forkhead associated (FHA) protein
MNMASQLSVTRPGGLTHTVKLSGAATIGRDNENDIVLDERTVSRFHAVLMARPEGMLLVDLESTNGCRVNDVPALPDTPVLLADGDLIALGHVMLRYHAAASDLPNP